MKPRFIHFQAIPPGDPKQSGMEWVRYRGFTAYLSDDLLGHGACRGVNVQIAYCSISDAFCKDTARDTAQAKPQVFVPVKDLPKALAEAQAVCYNRTLGKAGKMALRQHTNNWAWVWKYFL